MILLLSFTCVLWFVLEQVRLYLTGLAKEMPKTENRSVGAGTEFIKIFTTMYLYTRKTSVALYCSDINEFKI